MTLQSNADPHLLSGLFPVSSCFDLSLQFVIMHLLISICTQFHIPSCYPYCSSLFLWLGWFHSVWLFRDHNLGFQTAFFYGGRLSASCPTPNLEGQSILITLGAGWLGYTPRHQLPILVAFYNLHGPQWDYPLPRSPHGENFKHITQYFIS